MRLAHREKYALTFKLCAFALCPGFHANGVREKRGVRGENEALKRARCEKIKDPQTRACGSFLVPVVGVEPTWYRYHRILSPARLPIPPYRQKMRPLLQPRGILYHIHAKKSRDFQKKAKKIRNGCKNSKIPLVTAKNI